MQQVLLSYESLSNIGIRTNRITMEQKEYLGGISIVPIYLTKGMEFDSVILLDVDKEHYLDDAMHAKLLYVGCTRALHQLIFTYDRDLSPLAERVLPKYYQAAAYV